MSFFSSPRRPPRGARSSHFPWGLLRPEAEAPPRFTPVLTAGALPLPASQVSVLTSPAPRTWYQLLTGQRGAQTLYPSAIPGPDGYCWHAWFAPYHYDAIASVPRVCPASLRRLIKLVYGDHVEPYGFDTWCELHLREAPPAPSSCTEEVHAHPPSQPCREEGPVQYLAGIDNAMKLFRGTAHADPILQDMIGPTQDQLSREIDQGYYDMRPELVSLLQAEGIDASNDGVRSHSHPAHKTLENQLYSQVYPGLIPESSVAVFQAKQAKVDKLRRLHPRFHGPYNVTLDTKDFSRFRDANLPDTLNADAILLWDVGQYITPDVLGALHLKYPAVRRIYLGCVFPAESCRRVASCWPDLYTIRYHGRSLTYELEGSVQGAYEQPCDSTWLLKARRLAVHFDDRDVTSYLAPLNSLFAHHLIVSDRFPPTIPRGIWSVVVPDLMHIPQPWAMRLEPHPRDGEQLVPRELYYTLFYYFSAIPLKRRDSNDVRAKIRSMRNMPRWKHLRPDTWTLIERSIRAVCVLPVNDLDGQEFEPGFLAALLRALLKHFHAVKMPTTPAAAFTLLRALFSHKLGRTINVAIPVLQSAWKLACDPSVSGLLEAVGAVALAALLSLVPAPVVTTGVLGYYSTAWFLQHRERLQRRLHDEIFSSSFSLDFEPQDYAWRSAASIHHPFGLPNDPGSAPPSRPPRGPTDPGLLHNLRTLQPLCPWCSLPSLGPCSRCRTCPLHNMTDNLWQPGDEYSCCRALRQQAELAADLDGLEERERRDADRAAHFRALAAAHDRQRAFYAKESDEATAEILFETGVGRRLDPVAAAYADAYLRPDFRAVGPPEPEHSTLPAPASATSHSAAEATPPIPRDPEAPSGYEPQQLTATTAPPPLQDSTLAHNPEALTTKVIQAPAQACDCAEHSGPTTHFCSRCSVACSGPDPCHLCSESSHRCDCELHGPSGPRGLVRIRCSAGVPIWGRDNEDGCPCHACPPIASGRSSEWLRAHDLLGIPSAEVHSPGHRSLLVPPPDGTRSPTPTTCLLDAMATAADTSPAEVWQCLQTVVGSAITTALVPDPGLDQRVIHVWHLCLGTTAYLRGVPKGVPTTVGRRSGLPATTYHFSHVQGEPHWSLGPQASAPAPPGLIGGKLLPARRVRDFIEALDAFRTPEGDGLLGTWETHITKPANAKQLAREFKNGTFGTIKRLEGRDYERDFTVSMDLRVSTAKPRPIQLRRIAGFAGSGKTHPLMQFLKAGGDKLALSGTYIVALPRIMVRQDWHKTLGLGSGSFVLNTFEKLLTRSGRVLIADELSLEAPGYIDLVLACKPTISHVILLGDMCQAQFNNPHADTSLNELPNEGLRWFGPGVPYCLWTHRSPQVIAERLSVDTTNPVQGRVLLRYSLDPRYPVISATNFEVTVNSGLGYSARNISAHQGATYHTAQFVISEAVLNNVQDFDIYSAATRVSDTLILVLSWGPGKDHWLLRHRLLSAIAGVNTPVDFATHFAAQLAGCQILRLPPDRLADIRAKRLAALDPVYAHGKAALPHYNRAPRPLDALLHVEEPAPADPTVFTPAEQEPRIRTHLPRIDPDSLLESTLEGLTHREAREIINSTGMSELFLERPTQFTTSTDALFPVQKASDDALFRATVQKRLSRGTPADNVEDLERRAPAAALLLDAFFDIAHVPRTPVAFDAALFSECIYENEFVKLTKKSQAQLAANADRADPDWKLNFVKHFIKSQVKGKLEAIGIQGKAGQTLATCHDAVVLLFGPMVRYLRRQIMRKLPANIFCNCGRNAASQSAWAREFWRDGLSTTSDYTSFDSTQKGDSLGFETQLMRHHGLDEAWVALFAEYNSAARTLPELYQWWKLNITSDVIGPKETGRDTGEPGTYDFNTYFNLALIQLMYAPRPGTPIAVGGDDMAANARLRLTERWLSVKHLFLIDAKVEYTTSPEFCGFRLTRVGCFKNPRLLLLKTLWHIDKGDAVNVDLNYAAEAATAYALGDLLYDYCTFEELACQGYLIERYHRLYPSWASQLFGSPTAEEVATQLGALLVDLDSYSGGSVPASGAPLGRRARRSQLARFRLAKRLLSLFDTGGLLSWADVSIAHLPQLNDHDFLPV